MFSGCSDGPSGGLVGAGGVEGEGSDDLAGGGVEDADVEIGDEHDDGGSSPWPADADLVEATIVTERDLAGWVDDVTADAVMHVVASGRPSFGTGGVGNRGW